MGAKIKSASPLILGGAGGNFEILNKNTYFLLQIRILRLKARKFCLKLFFRLSTDGATNDKIRFNFQFRNFHQVGTDFQLFNFC